jgi:hypothetical protein
MTIPGHASWWYSPCFDQPVPSAPSEASMTSFRLDGGAGHRIRGSEALRAFEL